MIRVKVKFFGIFRKCAKNEYLYIDLEEPATIESLMNKLSSQINDCKKFFEFGLNDIKSNMIIVVNDKEIGVLEGLKTHVNDGDNVAIIPTIHGGRLLILL